MATLQESAQSILNEKNSKVLPENIVKGVTMFGIEGIASNLDTSDATAISKDIAKGKVAYVQGERIEGTSNATVNSFMTSDEMSNDSDSSENTLAILYPTTRVNVTKSDIFQKFIAPNEVVLTEALTRNLSVYFMPVDQSQWMDFRVRISSTYCQISVMGEDNNTEIYYESTDGITYTKMDGAEEIDLGMEVYPEESMWNDIAGYFIQVECNSFDGLYKYNKKAKDGDYYYGLSNTMDSLDIYIWPDGIENPYQWDSIMIDIKESHWSDTNDYKIIDKATVYFGGGGYMSPMLYEGQFGLMVTGYTNASSAQWRVREYDFRLEQPVLSEIIGTTQEEVRATFPNAFLISTDSYTNVSGQLVTSEDYFVNLNHKAMIINRYHTSYKALYEGTVVPGTDISYAYIAFPADKGYTKVYYYEYDKIAEAGVDTSDATATTNDILKGTTAYVNGEKIEGTYEPVITSEEYAQVQNQINDLFGEGENE